MDSGCTLKGLGSILLAVLCCRRQQMKQFASHLAILIRRETPGMSGGAWRTILVPQKTGALGRDSTPKTTSPLPSSACGQMGRGCGVIDIKTAPSCTGLMPVHLCIAEATLAGEGTVSSGRGTSKVHKPDFLRVCFMAHLFAK